MSRLIYTISTAGIATVALASAAAAQPARGFSGDASLSVRYDEDSTGISSAAASNLGFKQSDTIVTPMLRMRYDMPIGRNAVYADASTGYDFYADNSDLNRLRWSAGVGGNAQVGSRCSANVDASYSSQQSSYGDLGIAIDNLEKTQNYGFTAHCGTASGFGVTGGISHSIGKNSDFFRSENDLRATSYHAGITYATSALGTVSLTASRDDRKFANRYVLTPLGIEQDGVTVERLTLGVTRPIGARLLGNASVSYVKTKPDISSIEGYTGIGWSAGLSYKLGARTNISIDTARDATSSSGLDSTYQLTNNYGLNVSYQLGNRITLGAGGAIVHRKFKGVTPISFIPDANGNPILLPPRDKETTKTIFAEVGYQMNRQIGFSLNVAHDERSASNSFYDFSGNSVRLNATYSF